MTPIKVHASYTGNDSDKAASHNRMCTNIIIIIYYRGGYRIPGKGGSIAYARAKRARKIFDHAPKLLDHAPN